MDPYTAAKFFHFLIKMILRTLIGVETVQQHVKSHKGIFGRMSAFFGLVESQGWGSLHLHMLIWLKDAPPMDEIESLLKTEEFHQKVKDFIRANLRAYLPGFETADSIKEMPNDVEVRYSRPPNPDSPDYVAQVQDLEKHVAQVKQLHTCKYRRCLVSSKSGGFVCKRCHAPNMFGTVNMECTVDLRLSWSK